MTFSRACAFLLLGGMLFADTPAPAAPPSGLSSSPRFSAREVMHAFADAYPDRVGPAEWYRGDWTVKIDGVRFFFADGKLLPESDLAKASEYSAHTFYPYTRELPELRELSAEDHSRLVSRLADQAANPRKRNPGFYHALYRVGNREEAWAQTKTLYFLGKKVDVHRYLLEDLARVEEKLLSLQKYDAELAAFIRDISTATGSNWREIAGTASISFHSYGAAIDFLPAKMGSKQTYWRWTMEHDEYWYRTPYVKRYQPPMSFIRAFEEEGFIWGGKWFYFDSMHFEYRPEILILNHLRQ